ncbi:MAG: hypothetical protein PHC64_07060 [Candidatus Gastranaerophilales bacterium]|nr:hypothetical protein [Candidatus Gastranaerophilales bacterium]
MKKIKSDKKKHAQQMIEFLLVIPFVIIIFGILTEYAYALNINMTLNQGLKDVASSIYSEIEPGMTQSAVKTQLETDFIKYLDDNNVPTNGENNVKIGYFIQNQTAVFMASYTYVPAFTLPNVYFKILPDKFNFFTTTAVPAAFLGTNNYNSSIDSETLDKVWSTTASFSSDDDFDAAKKGIMKDNSSGGRARMIFLVPNAGKYLLVNWVGTILKSSVSGKTYHVDTSNGGLYECNSDGSSCVYSQKFFNYLTSNNYRNVIFIHDTETPAANLETQLITYWVDPPASTDLSQTTVAGILKRALAITDYSGFSIGNYDNLDVPTYSSSVSTTTNYKVQYFGSMVFVYNTSLDTIVAITNGQTAPNYNYSF